MTAPIIRAFRGLNAWSVARRRRRREVQAARTPRPSVGSSAWTAAPRVERLPGYGNRGRRPGLAPAVDARVVLLARDDISGRGRSNSHAALQRREKLTISDRRY